MSLQLSESSLACLEKLAILLFECYPYIPPVNRKATYSSLLRLIVGVSNDMAVLKAFLSRVGMRSCVCVLGVMCIVQGVCVCVCDVCVHMCTSVCGCVWMCVVYEMCVGVDVQCGMCGCVCVQGLKTPTPYPLPTHPPFCP